MFGQTIWELYVKTNRNHGKKPEAAAQLYMPVQKMAPSCFPFLSNILAQKERTHSGISPSRGQSSLACNGAALTHRFSCRSHIFFMRNEVLTLGKMDYKLSFFMSFSSGFIDTNY